jgi:hypothetical protein
VERLEVQSSRLSFYSSNRAESNAAIANPPSSATPLGHKSIVNSLMRTPNALAIRISASIEIVFAPRSTALT